MTERNDPHGPTSDLGSVEAFRRAHSFIIDITRHKTPVGGSHARQVQTARDYQYKQHHTKLNVIRYLSSHSGTVQMGCIRSMYHLNTESNPYPASLLADEHQLTAAQDGKGAASMNYRSDQ